MSIPFLFLFIYLFIYLHTDNIDYRITPALIFLVAKALPSLSAHPMTMSANANLISPKLPTRVRVNVVIAAKYIKQDGADERGAWREKYPIYFHFLLSLYQIPHPLLHQLWASPLPSLESSPAFSLSCLPSLECSFLSSPTSWRIELGRGKGKLMNTGKTNAQGRLRSRMLLSQSFLRKGQNLIQIYEEDWS